MLYLSNIIIHNKKHSIALRSQLLNYDSSWLVEPGPSKILKKQYLTSAVFPFNNFHCCFFSSKYLLIKTATSVRRFLLYRKQFKLQEIINYLLFSRWYWCTQTINIKLFFHKIFVFNWKMCFYTFKHLQINLCFFYLVIQQMSTQIMCII